MHINLDTVQLGFFMDAKDPEFFFLGMGWGWVSKNNFVQRVELT